MTTTTNTINSTIASKVGTNPTVAEVRVAAAEVVTSYLADDVERVMRSYFVERGLVPSMPAGHWCEGLEFTGCECPRL